MPPKPKKPIDSNDSNEENINIASAFRAVSSTILRVPEDTFVKVNYQKKQFDLAVEYNPLTSTFRPRNNGVYLVSATISFFPNNNDVNYRARIELRVNGKPAIAIDNDFFGPILFGNTVNVSSILKLNARDKVEVFAQSSTSGSIEANVDGEVSTHFEAARFPSPTS
ncbi:ABC transporter permease [Bacillus sp. AFS017336]|uniref:ABC transporter permease n=1 Tax=Bacillus sp. AFS017336 TaxID=2033489 RepID=UPI000BF071B9|nr:ABC transporter permease [Bacillus sp. AFS017336]PEL11996.1 ABC transporter permease [Bacillus sp. AFS017336]